MQQYRQSRLAQCVHRLSDGAAIPTDPDNCDYAEFLSLQTAGMAELMPNVAPQVLDEGPQLTVEELTALLETHGNAGLRAAIGNARAQKKAAADSEPSG